MPLSDWISKTHRSYFRSRMQTAGVPLPMSCMFTSAIFLCAGLIALKGPKQLAVLVDLGGPGCRDRK